MVNLNIVNFITIAIIVTLFVTVERLAMKAMGKEAFV